MNEFLAIGFDAYVNLGKVRVISPTDPDKLRREMKKRNMEKSSPSFWDTSNGKGVKSLLVLDDGFLVTSALGTDTLFKRFNDYKNGGNAK